MIEWGIRLANGASMPLIDEERARFLTVSYPDEYVLVSREVTEWEVTE